MQLNKATRNFLHIILDPRLYAITGVVMALIFLFRYHFDLRIPAILFLLSIPVSYLRETLKISVQQVEESAAEEDFIP